MADVRSRAAGMGGMGTVRMPFDPGSWSPGEAFEKWIQLRVADVLERIANDMDPMTSDLANMGLARLLKREADRLRR